MNPLRDALYEAAEDLKNEEQKPTIHSMLFNFMLAAITNCDTVNTYNPNEKKARLIVLVRMGIETRKFINKQKLQEKRAISQRLTQIISVIRELQDRVAWKVDIDSLDRKIDELRKIFKEIFYILIKNQTLKQVILPKYNHCHEIMPGPIIRTHNELLPKD